MTARVICVVCGQFVSDDEPAAHRFRAWEDRRHPGRLFARRRTLNEVAHLDCAERDRPPEPALPLFHDG